LYFFRPGYSFVIIGRDSYFVDTLNELLVTRFTLQWLSQPCHASVALPTFAWETRADSMRDYFVVKRRDGSSLPKRI